MQWPLEVLHRPEMHPSLSAKFTVLCDVVSCMHLCCCCLCFGAEALS